MSHAPGFVIIWEFNVLPDSESLFEQAYGSQGPWVKLFQTNPHFIRTELQRDLTNPHRYWTLDYWSSESAYNQFRTAHLADYRRIDVQCENLTKSEVELGRFTPLP